MTENSDIMMHPDAQLAPWAGQLRLLQTGAPRCALPLEALLLLPLLADLGELPLVVLARPALLGFPPRVVLHPLHLLLPGLHQLVVALADVLLLSTQTERIRVGQRRLFDPVVTMRRSPRCVGCVVLKKLYKLYNISRMIIMK